MFVYKVIILGESSAGKTSLMNKYVGGSFLENDTPTIGLEFLSKTMNVKNVLNKEMLAKYEERYINKDGGINQSDKLKLQIWDTSGQERFHSIVSSYYRNIDGVIFVCDLTRRETMNKIGRWIDDYNANANKPLETIGSLIVGMKSDLRKKNMDHVTDEELKEFAKRYDINCYIGSAKYDKLNIEAIFIDLINQMFKIFIMNPSEHMFTVKAYSLKTEKKQASNDCCLIL